MEYFSAIIKNYILPVIILILFAGIVFLAFNHYKKIEGERNSALIELESSRNHNYLLNKEIDTLEENIESFQDQIENIYGTVGTLKKLAETDEELLKKYSNIYFLNENYVPNKLSSIAKKYVHSSSSNYMIHSDVWPFLQNLLEEAHNSGHEILILSAFRSFDTQSSLKNQYLIKYGAGANAFSADQGYSEHQLGTAVDFTTQSLGKKLTSFGNDPVYGWLTENGYRFGFILSYPKENTYFKYEPWHWRFVGVELAKYLYENKKNFYELDQREIDKYLVKIFE